MPAARNAQLVHATRQQALERLELRGGEELVVLALDGEHRATHFRDVRLEVRLCFFGGPDLHEALEYFEKDEVVTGALGEHLTERFLEAKRAEVLQYNLQVSKWEIDSYLGRY